MMLTDEQLDVYFQGIEFRRDNGYASDIQEINLTKISIKWPDPLLTYNGGEWKKIVEPALKVSEALRQFGLTKVFILN